MQSGQDARADEAIDAIEAEGDEPSTEPSIALSDVERELSKPPLEAPSPEKGRGEPAPGRASGAFRVPADSLFASAPRSANIFATRTVGAPRELAASTSRDLFTTWRAPRPHQAFSMAQSAPRENENGASPPLGSVFSTRKDTASAAAPAAAPGPMLSPEAQRASTAFDRGLDLVKRKDHQRALEAWREAVALDPGNRTYQANLKRLERLIASIASART